ASWRWDADKRLAFCTCADKPLSIFDVIMRVAGGDFVSAAERAAEIIGRQDLIRRSTKYERAKYPDDGAQRPGLSLAGYAAAKGLAVDFLREVGRADRVLGQKPAVRIPYRASGGSEVAARFRIAPLGPDKFRWAKGSKAVPYGLDRLSDARDADFVVIVEGES